jgi:sterol 24-C-methyltransferase
MKVLDVGCGIGGPMVEITRFSGAKVTGVNNNAYQIQKGQALVSKYGLEGCCDFMKADFMKIPQPDNSYDAIYAIEATCHAPSKVGIYSEILRLLKPGGLFAAYEWCMTDKYDPENPEHNKYKKDIEVGDGIANLDTTKTVLEALQQSGFEIIEYKDLAVTDSKNPICWYQPLVPGYFSGWKGFRVSPLGIVCTTILVYALETLGLAQKGTVETHRILKKAYSGLLGGAQTGSFTPMFFFLVRKPLKS